LYGSDTLDAVYYYCRSLAVRSPILTARDGLTNTFEKIRRICDKNVAAKKKAADAEEKPAPFPSTAASESTQLFEWDFGSGVEDAFADGSTGSDGGGPVATASGVSASDKGAAPLSPAAAAQLRREWTIELLAVHGMLFVSDVL
jgi:hypothetical protein